MSCDYYSWSSYIQIYVVVTNMANEKEMPGGKSYLSDCKELNGKGHWPHVVAEMEIAVMHHEKLIDPK